MRAQAAIALLLVAVTASGQVVPTAGTSARSLSGQFLVTAPPASRVPPAASDPNVIRLEPALVAVSAERIKQAVWRELEYNGTWEQKVIILIRRARTADETVTIITDRSNGQWSYRLEMPDTLTRERYLRALVQVVLLELSNRSARDKTAEIPVWLTEGITFDLLCNQSTELILTPPQQTVNGISVARAQAQYQRVSSLEKAHKILVGTTPLTFDQLSWPVPNQAEGKGGPMYQASAQLFTDELLKLRGGSGCMRQFLADLPNFLNWQMAFLHAFETHFQRPLDIEKWWTLQAMEFAGRDLTQTWPYEESWSKLSRALVETVDIFVSSDQLPERSEVTLQTIIRTWDAAKQEEALQRKMHELGALRPRVAPELAALTAQYAETLETYLKKRAGFHLWGTGALQTQTLKRLQILDASLQRLRPQVAAEPVAAPNRDELLRSLRGNASLPPPGLRAN